MNVPAVGRQTDVRTSKSVIHVPIAIVHTYNGR